MSGRKFLAQAWQNALHGFSKYIDRSGRTIDGSETQKMLDTVEFRAAAAHTLLNVSVASNFGFTATIVAGAASILGGALIVTNAYDKSSDDLGFIINKNPDEYEKSRYGPESKMSAQVGMELINNPSYRGDTNASVYATLAATGVSIASLYAQEYVPDLPYVVIGGHVIQFCAGFIGAAAASKANEKVMRVERLRHIIEGDWVFQPSRTQKVSESQIDDLSTEGPFSPQPV